METTRETTKRARVTELPGHEAGLLRWYFQGGGWASAAMKSNFAAMVDQLVLRAGGRPCERCGGDPATGTGGTGFVPRLGKRAKRRAVSSAEALFFAEAGIATDPILLRSEPCPDCSMRGWTEASRSGGSGVVTARPTGSSVPAGRGRGVADEHLERLARVASRLARARERWSMAAMVLEAYYGDESRSLMALYDLTEAGTTLLRRKPESAARLSVMGWLAEQVIEERERHDPRRAALLTTAEEQAGEMLRHAHTVWSLAKDQRSAAATRASRVAALLGDP